MNIVLESDRDSPAEFSEPVLSADGHDHKVRVRVSLTGDDVVLVINTAETVLSAKRKLQAVSGSAAGNGILKAQESGKILPTIPEPSRQRWYYSGKLLSDKMRIGDANIPTGFVIQCVVNNLEFGVIRTKD